MSTLVVYSDTSDGQIYSPDGFDDYDYGWEGVYSVARAGTGSDGVNGLTDSPSTPTEAVGQLYYARTNGSSYAVWESFLGFDTSSLTSGASVSAAVLRVTSALDLSTTDFTIQARLRDWGATLTTADWVPGADLSGLTLLGSYATASGFTANTGYDLSDTAMAANVNKTGSTRMLLCSSRTVGNNAPTGNEYVTIYAADQSGTTSDPKLTVTYTAGSTGYAHSQIVMIR